jgi:pimeloyl-ACP methyl ester carboxylesterase
MRSLPLSVEASTAAEPPFPTATSEPVDPARLHVQGQGPPLIYVPGLDGTGLLFYRQVRLLWHRFRVITYRLRDEARDMDTLVRDIVSHLARAVPDHAPAVVVGESFGGALATNFALAHPDKVERLVILNSFSRITPAFKLPVALVGLSMVPWSTMQFVRRYTAARLHSKHTHAEEIQRFLLLTSGTTKHGYLNRLRILREHDLRLRLHALRVPTLYLAADEDHLIPSVREARLMASLAPCASVQVLAGHGHGCFLAPDLDLNEILLAWEARQPCAVLEGATPPDET